MVLEAGSVTQEYAKTCSLESFVHAKLLGAKTLHTEARTGVARFDIFYQFVTLLGIENRSALVVDFQETRESALQKRLCCHEVVNVCLLDALIAL